MPEPTSGRQLVRDQRTEEDRRVDNLRDTTEGLTSLEARTRLDHYGRNALKEEERSVWSELLSHFWGPIPWMIEAALLLTALTARWADFGIILALLLLNGGVGFWEEHQARSAIAALKQRLARRAEVNRDGEWRWLAAEELVPGDLVRIRRGELVPADGRVAQGECEADESALTGESLPVGKRPGEDMYSPAVVSRGAVALRVLATGEHTQFGRAAELAGRQAPRSHFQRAIVRIGRYLIALAVALVGVIVVVSLLRGTGLVHTLEFALVVTIASIPVALPAVLSVTMAVGARHLAKRDAVVSHLPAVEEMAGVDVLCADKTGTITRNELAVAEVAVLDGQGEQRVLRQAALTAERDAGDPIDAAVLAATDTGRLSDWRVTEFTPFDSSRKYARADLRAPDGTTTRVAKGAVQAILDLAHAEQHVRDRVEERTRAFADRGYRALAVAHADNRGWSVSGVLGLQDPPRQDSRDTLHRAHELGVRVTMITGDRAEIAHEIAHDVGMGTDIMESSRIEALHGDQLAETVERTDGFAQVVPEDKYRIVEAFQHRDHIVGMTGDGVNDAPALRRADVGIAVAGATDAARAASDIVLLAPGLSTIVEAIHRSREVFRRMKNYAIYRIAETIRVVVFVTATIVIYDFFPVTPVQVVLLAILNDAAILAIAYDRVRAAPRPQRWNLDEVTIVASALGLAGVVSSLLLVWLALGPLELTRTTTQTLIYLKLSVAGHFTVFVARTRERFWSHRPAWILLAAVVGTQMLATAIAGLGLLMEPLGWGLIGLAWAWAAVWFFILDQLKVVVYRALDRRARAWPG
ncbi:plasma-membrane proton-efflux P-type ATPase [Saccharomonospora marina XMU15]|uniref:Plasma-membrane proton-efflux P-type ATPase n=1 Tax=Saccharomonospora marina XMU15 TaxID=882083 RepID=H5X0M1_9PSEU|nr:plasma-membrane proton-efflux P-type ATPase [Saccharomonospora marina]EHR50817.1 plasma-membrane proton-efflux P-type ATPase [Saccharomonospora marina XMU15]